MKLSIKLTPFHFEEIVKKGYSLDHIFILQSVESNIDLKPLSEKSAKVEVLINTCKRKGLISDDDKLTIEGKGLLDFLSTKTTEKFVKKNTEPTSFDNFWAVFPGTDTFKVGDRIFKGSRSLRVNKDECRTKWNKILNEGEYTAEIIIKAIQLDIAQKKEMSVKKGENKITYMQNSLTYLNQRSYEPFIDLLKDEKLSEQKPEVKIYTGIDI